LPPPQAPRCVRAVAACVSGMGLECGQSNVSPGIMEAPSTPSDAEHSLLLWLESEPVGAVEDDLAALRARMHDVFGDAGPGTNAALLRALAERIGDIGARLRPLLLARQLPVEVPLF